MSWHGHTVCGKYAVPRKGLCSINEAISAVKMKTEMWTVRIKNSLSGGRAKAFVIKRNGNEANNASGYNDDY